MTQVEAVFAGGVFRPLGTIALPENQRVQLNIQPIEAADVQGWLQSVQQMQQRLVAERGCFPDSTPDIAADRARDE